MLIQGIVFDLWWYYSSPGEVMNVHQCFWPHPWGLNKIFVRECYEKIWLDHIKPYLQNPFSDTFLYGTGMPGIGKKKFLYYVLCHIKALGLKVILNFGRETVYLGKYHSPQDTSNFPSNAITIYDPDSIKRNSWHLGDKHISLLPCQIQNISKFSRNIIRKMW